MLCVLLLAGVAPSQPGLPADPAALVRQLGDGKFDVREAAEAELAALGLAAQPALEAGLKNADVEVRTRCARLLTAVRVADRKARVKAFLDGGDLPGWARFQEVLGPTATRKAFAAVYQADPALLDLAAKDAKQTAGQVAERARNLGLLLLQPQRDKDALAELPALLFVAGDPRVPVEPAALTALYGGLAILARREAVRKEFLDDAVRAALVLPVLQRGGESGFAMTLPLAGELELRSARDWAVHLLGSPTPSAATRAQAMLLLARLGDPKDAETLKPFLSDKTAVGSVTVAGQRLNAELGDVALAATLQLKGEKPGEYGFPYYEAVPGLKKLPSPERLGFVDAAGRAAALKKWQEKR